MAGKKWTTEELNYLFDNYENKTCSQIAKKLNRSTRSVQHKFNQEKLEKRKAKLGEIINGWKIIEIFNQYNGNQNVSMAKIKAINSDKVRITRLSLLSNNSIGHPDPKRLDNIERNTTHGMSKSRPYTIWSGMLNRCTNEKQGSYKNYGGRGIKVCEDWLIFENFWNWAKTSGYSEDLTLDRLDNDKDYCPENCQWATKTQQIINRRTTDHLMITAFGQTKHLIEWLSDNRCKTTNGSLRYRLQAGWEPEIAITKPAERKSKKNLTNWLKENYPNIFQEYKSL
jgi:hypothetical protein